MNNGRFLFYDSSSGHISPYYISTDTANGNSYTVTTSCMHSSSINSSYHSIDIEAGRCIIDDSYFDLVLNEGLRDAINIDINFDRTKTKELRDYLFKYLNKFFDRFVERGIIDDYGVLRINFIYNYIKVEYYILRNDKLINLERYYSYKSENYGLR